MKHVGCFLLLLSVGCSSNEVSGIKGPGRVSDDPGYERPESARQTLTIKSLARVQDAEGLFVKVDDAGVPYFQLELLESDFNVSAGIADQLNNTLIAYEGSEGVTKYLPVAKPMNASTVHVYLPTKEIWQQRSGSTYPRFTDEPVLYVDRVLRVQIPIFSIPRRSTVAINTEDKTIAWNAEVVVRAGRVQVGALTVGREDRESTLGQLMDAAMSACATQQERISIVKALKAARMLEAELIEK